jgi:hypothetical protein
MNALLPVSVILPVYNHARFLNRALAALLVQAVAPFEILVIDDASADDSAEVAERWRPLFEPAIRLRILRNAVNLGVNRSLNRGLEEARGAYVVCTAADDWLRPRFLADMTAAAARFPGARLLTSTLVEHFEATGRTFEHGRDSEQGPWYSETEAFFDPAEMDALLRRGHVAMPVSASMIHAATIRDLGGFDPPLKWHADWFVSMAIALRFGFAIVPEPLAVFRIAAGTYSGDNVRSGTRQDPVCAAICQKLAGPEFADVRRQLLRTPSPLAPFVRYMIAALVRRPRDWDLLAGVARWWLGEMLKGRRPGRLRKLVESFGVSTAPRPRKRSA